MAMVLGGRCKVAPWEVTGSSGQARKEPHASRPRTQPRPSRPAHLLRFQVRWTAHALTLPADQRRHGLVRCPTVGVANAPSPHSSRACAAPCESAATVHARPCSGIASKRPSIPRKAPLCPRLISLPHHARILTTSLSCWAGPPTRTSAMLSRPSSSFLKVDVQPYSTPAQESESLVRWKHGIGQQHPGCRRFKALDGFCRLSTQTTSYPSTRRCSPTLHLQPPSPPSGSVTCAHGTLTQASRARRRCCRHVIHSVPRHCEVDTGEREGKREGR
jgi:hypothetical protein